MSATMKQAQDALAWLEASYDAHNYSSVPLPQYNPEQAALAMLGYYSGPIRTSTAKLSTRDQQELSSARLHWSAAQHPGMSFNYGSQAYFDALYGDLQGALAAGHAKSTGFSGFGAVATQADADAAFISWLATTGQGTWIPATTAPNGVSNGPRGNGNWESVVMLPDGSKYMYGAIDSSGTVHSHAEISGTGQTSAPSVAAPTHGSTFVPVALNTPSASATPAQQAVTSATNSTSAGDATPTPPAPPASSGLSTGAKIGIGAALLGGAAIALKMRK